MVCLLACSPGREQGEKEEEERDREEGGEGKGESERTSRGQRINEKKKKKKAQKKFWTSWTMMSYFLSSPVIGCSVQHLLKAKG